MVIQTKNLHVLFSY